MYKIMFGPQNMNCVSCNELLAGPWATMATWQDQDFKRNLGGT